jgi:hypothetical protein
MAHQGKANHLVHPGSTARLRYFSMVFDEKSFDNWLPSIEAISTGDALYVCVDRVDAETGSTTQPESQRNLREAEEKLS